jgi:NAD(P)H-quinone oxidoreductase subunit 5
VVTVGLVSALFGTLAARVQADIKSGLAFASLTQVGLITAEIGLGLRYIPLIHIIGHASLRTLQLLRAPSLLQDYHLLENAVGGHLEHEDGPPSRWAPAGLYRLCFHRGQLDATLDRFLVRPFAQAFRWCDRMENRWTDFLSGPGSRESNRVAASAPTGEQG